MNPVDNTFDDVLTGTLRQAVAQIKQQPVPKEFLRQQMDRLESWSEPLRFRQQRRRRFWAVTSLAASILLIAWLSWPSDGWAQVVKAVQQKTWIRAQYEGEWGPMTLWFSAERKVAANTGPHQVFFHDARLHVMYRYDANEKTVYRLPETERDQAMTTAALSLFADIMQGKEKIQGNLMAPAVLTRQSQREVTENGTKYLEFVMEHAYPHGTPGPSVTNVVRVDAQTRLPVSFTLKDLTPRPSGQFTELRFAVDYPATGPLDIYDLGVARTSKYVDRIPPDDVERIADSIKTNRETFDAYAGIVIAGENPYVRVWRKGKKWRIEKCPALPMQQPANLAEPGKWWLTQTDALIGRAQEVCDGTHLYTLDHKNYLPSELKIENAVSRRVSFTFGVPEMEQGLARLCFPELIAYSMIPVGSQHYAVAMKADKEKGLEDKIQLHARLTQAPPGGAARLQRFWVDPTHGYLVSRHDIAEWDGLPDRLVTRSLKKLARAPSGIWYPETIEGTYTNLTFYLDFKADLPDELFTPTERKKK